jgi:hypothetical protein
LNIIKDQSQRIDFDNKVMFRQNKEKKKEINIYKKKEEEEKGKKNECI